MSGAPEGAVWTLARAFGVVVVRASIDARALRVIYRVP